MALLKRFGSAALAAGAALGTTAALAGSDLPKISASSYDETTPGIEQIAQAASATEIFRDDFDGEVLAEAWEVMNIDTDSYIVEDGQLLTIASSVGTREALDFTNIFRLSEDPPPGDWVATAKLNLEFATGHDTVFLGLVDGQEEAIYAWLNAWRGQYKESFSLSTIKRSKGQERWSVRQLYKDNYKGKPAADTLGQRIAQPIYLRLAKTGRSYIAGVKLGDGEDAQWIDTDKMTLLRAKGRLALGSTQGKAGNGETLIFFDWVKVESSAE